MRFCFYIITGWLTVSALSAAGLEAVPGHATWVVRADRRTGRLVRTVLVPQQPRINSAGRMAVADVVEQTAKLNKVDPSLVHSVIQAESGYQQFAVSPKGAQGVMQLMPATARRFGVANAFNITENIQGGVRYLRYLMDLFQDETLAVAAYNAGEEAVIRHGGVPPFRETLNYVRTVTSSYASARKKTAAATVARQGEVAPPEPAYRPIEAFLDEQGNVHVRTK